MGAHSSPSTFLRLEHYVRNSLSLMMNKMYDVFMVDSDTTDLDRDDDVPGDLDNDDDEWNDSSNDNEIDDYLVTMKPDDHNIFQGDILSDDYRLSFYYRDDPIIRPHAMTKDEFNDWKTRETVSVDMNRVLNGLYNLPDGLPDNQPENARHLVNA